uniref:Uncharacterized protein n=1 Tax=Rhizophora mucronata TaxID=61149 RepID=A0A2P2QHF2_RHIMU
MAVTIALVAVACVLLSSAKRGQGDKVTAPFYLKHSRFHLNRGDLVRRQGFNGDLTQRRRH